MNLLTLNRNQSGFEYNEVRILIECIQIIHLTKLNIKKMYSTNVSATPSDIIHLILFAISSLILKFPWSKINLIKVNKFSDQANILMGSLIL